MENKKMSKKISTPEDLLNAKCPKCTEPVMRFGSRSQVNFKCTNKQCSKFYSEEILRENI